MVNFNVVDLGHGSFHWVSNRKDSCIAVDGSIHGKTAEKTFCSALRAAGVDCYPEERFDEVSTGKLIINLINAPS